MDAQVQKFLDFNGHEINFAYAKRQYWVAVKPLCEALQINYNRQFQNIKSDEILSELFAEQQIVAADGKLRKMICLPERYVYGWLFSVRSESEELKGFKRKCYDVLYDHFHGALAKREEALHEDLALQSEIDELDKKIKESKEYKQILELKKKQKKTTLELGRLDKELVQERIGLWTQDFVK